jgi:hypothetical protein
VQGLAAATSTGPAGGESAADPAVASSPNAPNGELPKPEFANKPADEAKPRTEGRFSLTLKAGAEYDSNVAISQISSSTGIGDAVGNASLSASYKVIEGKTFTLTAGYDFSQSLHAQLSQYDIQFHSGSIAGQLKAGKAYLGMNYSFSHILLGGQPFLDLHFTSPSVMFPVAPLIFVRPSLVYLDETFLTDRARDAKHVQPGMQLFWFFNHAHSYLLLGGNWQREKTVGPEFTYKGYALAATLSLPLKLLKQPGKIKADFERLSRNYDNVDLAIGDKRFDRVSTFKLRAEVPLTDHLTFGLEGKHAIRHSNQSYANLPESTVGAELVFKF